ncbi:hypothetical protein CSB20_07160 [bacterium DOLZORAL124_64_63]|nr:MAG: hypothetical protein CSB20_07160 [bacterium DOLZORAL124_64_63]
MVGKQHTSRLSQALLAKRGLGPALLKPGAAPAGKAYDGVDTLKVLIVRISFETNRDSTLTSVSPSGDFLLEPPANMDDLHVDRPPHNRQFYEAHLHGLSEYYNYQSGGRLHIEGTVLPQEENGSYKLSDPADYGPGQGGWWNIETLEALVRDMIDAGDQGTLGTEYDFSLHDDDDPFTYIIFVHAGSDWQSDINGDSPNDIPTFFVTLGEPHSLAGGGLLSECSIIPETTTQDDHPGSIAAALYHEFGHALGLVDVYNTSTGYPAAGIWDLMDSGTNLPVTMGFINSQNDTIVKTATGVLPPSLGVWDKWFLGWVETQEVDGSETEYTLPAVQVPRDQYALWDESSGDFDLNYPQALRAGASPREYFLIENRFVPPVPDALGTRTPYPYLTFIRDLDTDVVLYLGTRDNGIDTNSGMYDYFLPAGGLLVWHVNMDRISANLDENTINAWNDGLILMESDGIQDIGVLDSYVLGWYGSYRDPFNEANGATGFGPGSNVSSRFFDRSWSGVQLSGIHNRYPRTSSVMRFDAQVQPLVGRFPWQAASVSADEAAQTGGTPGARGLDTRSLTPVTFADRAVFFFADADADSGAAGGYPHALYALDAAGEPAYEAVAGRPEGAAWPLDAPLAGPPVLLDAEGAVRRLVVATRDGTVAVVRVPATGSLTLVRSADLADSLRCGPVALRNSAQETVVAAVTGADSLVFWNPETGLEVSRAALAGDLLGTPVAAWNQTAQLYLPTTAGLVLADLDGAAESLILAWDRTPAGKVRLVSPDGLSVIGFDDMGLLPVSGLDDVPGSLSDLSQALVGQPAVADLDGDGRQDLILATAGHVYAYSREGVALTGWPCRLADLFPLAEGTRLAGDPLVGDITGDGVNEVMISTSGGHLIGLDARGRLLPELPFKWGDDGTGALALAGDGAGHTLLWMVSPGGYATEPLARNHVNGRVMAMGWGPIAAAGTRTSQWLGTAGGPLRLGPSGEARALGAEAPLAAEMGRALLYPNPIHDTNLTVRFYAPAAGEARFHLYNLEGQEISQARFPTTAGAVNEHQMDVSGLVSGMYLARLIYPGTHGQETRTLTLAVER